jgi:hypothetical protein
MRFSLRKKSASPSAPATEWWDIARDEETIRLAFEESQTLYTLYGDYVDAIDRKVTAVFGVASAIIGLAPSLGWAQHLSGTPKHAWWVAIAAWIIVTAVCYGAYRPRGFRLGPDPSAVEQAQWTHLTPTEYRYFRLRWMGKTYTKNMAEIARKVDLLGVAIGFGVIEVVALLVAFLTGHLV